MPDKYREFTAAILQWFSEGGTLEYDEFLAIADCYKVITHEPYNPVRHGDLVIGVLPGEDYWVPAKDEL